MGISLHDFLIENIPFPPFAALIDLIIFSDDSSLLSVIDLFIPSISSFPFPLFISSIC